MNVKIKSAGVTCLVGDDYDHHYTNEEGNPYANAHGSLLMPLRIGISVAYILK